LFLRIGSDYWRHHPRWLPDLEKWDKVLQVTGVTWAQGELFNEHQRARTRDPDEAQAAVTEAFVCHQLRPLGRTAPLEMTLNAVKLPSVTAGYLRYGRDVFFDSGSDEVANYHIDIPVCGRAEARTGLNDPVEQTVDTGAVFIPKRSAEIRWGADCAQLCIMIDRQELNRELERLLGRPTRKPLDFTPSMDLATPAIRSWMEALHLLHRESTRPDGLLRHRLATHNLERVIMDGLLLAQPHNHSDALSHADRPARPHAVRLAIDLMHSHPEHPWSSAALAEQLAISVRALQEGFRRSVGLSPMAYLRDLRLDRAHQELTTAAEGTPVTEVALRWGFLHLGRFAAAYRNRFGHLPSQTLHRAVQSEPLHDRG
jgi:AraC-like DNA-binding protein